MRAVNLIPSGYRAGKAQSRGGAGMATYAVLGVLAVLFGLVTIYVISSNSVADQKSKLTALQQQLPQLRAEAAQLAPYTQFVSLAQARAQTVQQIAGSRFDWAASLDQLSKVVPANTSLSTLSASTNSGPASAASQAHGASGQPTVELHGCTGSQDDVARLMSRLRLISGAVRVSLSNAGKAGGSAPAGAAPASATSTGGGGSCSHGSNFDLTVAFQPPAGSGAPAGGAAAAAPAAQPAGQVASASPAAGQPAAPAATSSGGTQ